MGTGWLIVAALLVAAGVFCFGLACIVYTAYRFLSIAITLDAQFSRELGAQRQILEKYFRRAPEGAGEGFFDAPDDADLRRMEDQRALKRAGWPDEELEDILDKAYGG